MWAVFKKGLKAEFKAIDWKAAGNIGMNGWKLATSARLLYVIPASSKNTNSLGLNQRLSILIIKFEM